MTLISIKKKTLYLLYLFSYFFSISLRIVSNIYVTLLVDIIGCLGGDNAVLKTRFLLVFVRIKARWFLGKQSLSTAKIPHIIRLSTH